MRQVSVVLLCGALLGGCASGPGVRVIEQSDSKPGWASVSRTVYQDGSTMRFVGYFTADGDSRPSAVINGSASKARAMPLDSIADDFLHQSGVAEDLHESSSKFILSVLRKNPPTIPSLQVTSNHWERVEIKGSAEENPRTEVRAFSMAECSVGDFNEAKKEALRRLKGDPQIKKELDHLMAQQRDRAYGSDRTPASMGQ